VARRVSDVSQESAFRDGEADAWIRRNPGAVTVAPSHHPALAALGAVGVGESGSLIDVGGAAGSVAAGFLRLHPGWSARVVDLSGEAIEMGRAAFPEIRFDQGSITRSLPLSGNPDGGYDVVLVSGVLCWVERALLSAAVASTDAALADGGLLVISDFNAPHQRINPYAHRPGLFTYKQDYTQCYLGLAIYHEEYRRSYVAGSESDPTDPYDARWVTSVLRKDLNGRYARLR
jgi:SAM-dependent methyltransferase